MPNLTQRLMELKEAEQRHQRRADKAQGALESTMKELLKKFGVKTLEEAEALLIKERKALKKQRLRAEAVFERVKKHIDKRKEELDGESTLDS